MSGFRGFPPELLRSSRDSRKTTRRNIGQPTRPPRRTRSGSRCRCCSPTSTVSSPVANVSTARDVRFSKDKSPYKLWADATSESRAVGGTGYYLRVQASGPVTGCGAMVMARDQLQRFRASLDDDASGHRFEELTTELAARSLPVTSGAEPPLKAAPPGYPKSHPRAEFLRWKERSSSRNMRERNGCTLPRRSAEYATSGVEQNRSRNGSTPRLGTNEEPRHIDRRPAATGHSRCAPGEFPRGSLPQPGTGDLGVGRSAGLGAGAILGGPLTTVSWRLTFAINVPLTLLGALGGARWLSSTRDRTTGHCPAGVRLDARHRHRAHTRPSPTILFGPSSAAEGASNPSSPASRPGDPDPADPAP
jgi:hypothetical protein